MENSALDVDLSSLLEHEQVNDLAWPQVTLSLHEEALLPSIAVTPMTPDPEHDKHSTISLNSSNPSPLPPLNLNVNHGVKGGQGSSFGGKGGQGEDPGGMEPEALDFFAARDSILGQVTGDVETRLWSRSRDGDLLGTFLLTEVDTWDHEWERLVLLGKMAFLVVKYDFIGMKVEEWRRVELSEIDKVVQGQLVYPQNSLTPKINQIAGGIKGMVRDCILPRVQDTVSSVSCKVWGVKTGCVGVSDLSPQEVAKEAREEEENEDKSNENGGSIMSVLRMDHGKTDSRSRKAQGVQIIWNEREPLRFHQRWNPFDKSIPQVTFTSHPLFWYKGGGSLPLFDAESFVRELVGALGSFSGGGDLSPCVRIEYKPILIESYVGISSLLHNANSLGFYKVRGKVSF